MRIVHRIYDLYSGGAEVVLLSFIEAFPEHEHVVAFSHYYETWLAGTLRQSNNVRLVCVERQTFSPLLTVELPDLIIFHFYLPMSGLDLKSIPTWAIQRSIVYNHTCLQLPVDSGISKCICVSKYSLSRSGIQPSNANASVIVNPVRSTFFTSKRVSHLQHFCVGRHSRPSNAKFASDFFEMHEAIRIPRLVVSVLGAPPELTIAAQRLAPGHSHLYKMLEFNSMPIKEFLETLDVYLYKVSALFDEACPVSILEAMACGIPVVAENRAGIADIIIHGRTGFLCEERNDYLDAVNALWVNEGLRARIGSAAREWAHQTISLEAYRARIKSTLEI
jgi:hypothetical protein